jgi:PAS domain S-box-containing protein
MLRPVRAKAPRILYNEPSHTDSNMILVIPFIFSYLTGSAARPTAENGSSWQPSTDKSSGSRPISVSVSRMDWQYPNVNGGGLPLPRVKKRGADLQKTSEALLAEIGERRRAEEALCASEQRLQDILDNTTAVVFVKDLDLRYILVNREYERRHQVRRDEIRGKTDFDIHSHDVAETVRANDRHVIEAGTPIQFEEAVPMAEGERQYVVVKFLLRDHPTKPYAICGIATDITDIKRAEEPTALEMKPVDLKPILKVAERFDATPHGSRLKDPEAALYPNNLRV